MATQTHLTYYRYAGVLIQRLLGMQAPSSAKDLDLAYRLRLLVKVIEHLLRTTDKKETMSQIHN